MKESPQLTYHPLVSIIIPVYNGSNYIRESIESALEQTYKNLEVIVVNDGSKDDGATERVVLQYASRVRYITKDNGGVASALNAGIKAMRGDWFSWLSHDDLYAPRKVEEQVLLLDTLLRMDPRVDITKCFIHCDGQLIDSSGRQLTKLPSSGRGTEKNNLNMILSNERFNGFGGCGFLIPKSAFDDIGVFNEDMLTVQDVHFWYSLLLNGYHFHNVPIVLVHSRVHQAQTTYQKALKGKEEQLRLHQWLLQELWNQQEYRRSCVFMTLGRIYWCKGYWSSARLAFAKARNLINPVAFYLQYLAGLPYCLAYYLGRGIWRFIVYRMMSKVHTRVLCITL